MKNKITTILIIAITLFVSDIIRCQTFSKTENWQGKSIILPSIKQMRYESSKYTNPLLKKIKILTIINGSCPACVDELKAWKNYMKVIDTTQVGFVYVIHSDDNLFTFKELNNEYIKLSYPYFNDIKKTIANKLSKNKSHQTFLLNSKNEVILVGNPNKSKELFKRYHSEIEKRMQKNEPNVVVKEGANKTTIKINKGFIYKDQNGNILSPLVWKKMLSDNKFVPNIDTENNVITFKER